MRQDLYNGKWNDPQLRQSRPALRIKEFIRQLLERFELAEKMNHQTQHQNLPQIPETLNNIFFQILIIFFYRKKYIFAAVLTKSYNHARHCNKSKKNHC